MKDFSIYGRRKMAQTCAFLRGMERALLDK